MYVIVYQLFTQLLLFTAAFKGGGFNPNPLFGIWLPMPVPVRIHTIQSVSEKGGGDFVIGC